MKNLARKPLPTTLRMARGTATMAGLVVMIALVLGVGSVALAAVAKDHLNGFDHWNVEAAPCGFNWKVYAMAVCARVGNP